MKISIDIGQGKTIEIDPEGFNYLSCIRCGVNVVSYADHDIHLCIKCYSELIKEVKTRNETK